MGVVIKAIRDSAKDEACTFRLEDCSHDPSSTVFCHAPSVFKGAATKVDDWWGAYGCTSCHRIMDEHLLEGDERRVWMRAIAWTQRRLYEKGIMQFPERAKAPRVVNKIVPRPAHFRR